MEATYQQHFLAQSQQQQSLEALRTRICPGAAGGLTPSYLPSVDHRPTSSSTSKLSAFTPFPTKKVSSPSKCPKMLKPNVLPIGLAENNALSAFPSKARSGRVCLMSQVAPAPSSQLAPSKCQCPLHTFPINPLPSNEYVRIRALGHG